MPELPEVETTRRGIEPHLLGQTIRELIVRNPRLRWPVCTSLARELCGRSVRAVDRRGKYLLLRTEAGCLIVHLGMSGSLRLVNDPTPPGKHDHVDLLLDSGQRLRLRDPRRFGSLHWTPDPDNHPLLNRLGPEPWDAAFNANYLHDKARKRRQAIKNFLMDSHIVVGVGNIYANEVLYATGIRPTRPAGRISAPSYGRIVNAVRTVLEQAIEHGGTTLRDFVNGDGKPGYFRHELQVYDRAGQPCGRCATTLRSHRVGQRSSFFCPRCQH